jgi:Protein of unknown function (DUF3617)
MWRWGVAVVLTVAGAVPALAADLPHRKPGLWEIKIAKAGSAGATTKLCTDAETDDVTMMAAGPLAREACPKIDTQQSGDTMTIDAACTVAGKTATAHTVITGSFDSAYTLTTTAQGEALPGGGMAVTVDARWLGPCEADQKPGDMILGNGIKLNILELRKRAPSQGIPLPR